MGQAAGGSGEPCQPQQRQESAGRLVAEGTPEALRERVTAERGLPPTMENVFMAYTGRSLDEDAEEEEPDDDR